MVFRVLYIPSGAGFLPSTVLLYHTLDPTPTEWPVTTLLLVWGVDPSWISCVFQFDFFEPCPSCQNKKKIHDFFHQKRFFLTHGDFWFLAQCFGSIYFWGHRLHDGDKAGGVWHWLRGQWVICRICWQGYRGHRAEWGAWKKCEKKKVVRWWTCWMVKMLGKCWEDLIQSFFLRVNDMNRFASMELKMGCFDICNL